MLKKHHGHHAPTPAEVLSDVDNLKGIFSAAVARKTNENTAPTSKGHRFRQEGSGSEEDAEAKKAATEEEKAAAEEKKADDAEKKAANEEARAGKEEEVKGTMEAMKANELKIDPIAPKENGAYEASSYAEGNTDVMPIPGMSDLGVGYNAKEPCVYSGCEKARIIPFTYKEAKKYRSMGKVYDVPDQVTVEPVYSTNAKTDSYQGRSKVQEAFQAEASVSASGWGFSGAASARFGSNSAKDENTEYSIRKIDSTLYRLRLNSKALGPFAKGECETHVEKDFCAMLVQLSAGDVALHPGVVIPFVQK
jgi:hypothetical protein